MIEKPILFSGPLVRAILAGKKTQTRRVIKPDWYRCLDLEDPTDVEKALERCRYGKPGAQLWVRETWSGSTIYDNTKPSLVHDGAKVAYRASGGDRGLKGRPSIFMPRWASRINLIVKGIRVERVHDIGWEDALAEGIEPVPCSPCHDGAGCTDCMGTGIGENPVHQFAELWESINGKRGYGWELNPWVWVVDFERISHG